MFIPFSIKKTTIENICHGQEFDYDTTDIEDRIKSNINLELIKKSLIDGTRLQEEWFPSESYDSSFQVFISHSHEDDTIVRQLAGYLQKHYGIRSFIDSIYWGYINDLQKSLDDFYASFERDGRKYYDYDKRNFLTANVHIMLSMALAKMMDACECLIFVDSDNSLKYSKNNKNTPSPWIYEEMGFSKRLRVNIPERYKDRIRVSINESRERSSYSFMMFSATESRQPQFNYEVDMRQFRELTQMDFPANSHYDAYNLLDRWYKKYGVKNVISRFIGN